MEQRGEDWNCLSKENEGAGSEIVQKRATAALGKLTFITPEFWGGAGFPKNSTAEGGFVSTASEG